jgi:hypothetical protein
VLWELQVTTLPCPTSYEKVKQEPKRGQGGGDKDEKLGISQLDNR